MALIVRSGGLAATEPRRSRDAVDEHAQALRLFELPGAMLAGAATPSQTPWTETFQSKEAECVYDYCWFPHMHSDAPATCVFASRAPERNTPPPRNIHVAAAASTRPRAPRNIHSQPRRSREA